MGDKNKTLEKAKLELEELYMGIPDESVNLTFQDLAKVNPNSSPERKTKVTNTKNPSHSSLLKLPSLDFHKALQQAESKDRHHDGDQAIMHASPFHRLGHHHPPSHRISPERRSVELRLGEKERSMTYGDGDESVISMASTYLERGHKRRRPGIPHSNICTNCSNYIYVFRHRCLVCGRVYCRNCVSIGMGEMTEGRKCIQCLGRRFSQRYIKQAGEVGCCIGYPSIVKQAELKWAEKGPRRSGERTYNCGGGGGGSNTIVSRSRSPVTPTRANASNSHSFVAASPYSPYNAAAIHHHLPL